MIRCPIRISSGYIGYALVLSVVAIPAPAHAREMPANIARRHPIIAEAATRFAIPEDWIERVIRAESAGLTMMNGRPIRSSVGAIGLMELMPATWAAMRDVYRPGTDPDDPHDNIMAAPPICG